MRYDPDVRATPFEFRHRFGIIAAIFFAGFYAHSLDPSSAVPRVVGWLGVPRGERLVVVRLVYLVDAGIALGAALLRTWATAYLRADVVHDLSLHADRVVADGPYRHVRNPLYLGTFVLAITLGALANVYGFALIVAGVGLFTLRLIGREEAALGESQGPSYEAFCASVPRLLPSVRPRVPAAGLQPTWSAAFVGELSMWAFATAILLVAITLQMRYAYPAFAFGVAWLAILAAWSARKPAAPRPTPTSSP